MVEYALILVLVSIVVIVILLTMGGQIANVLFQHRHGAERLRLPVDPTIEALLNERAGPHFVTAGSSVIARRQEGVRWN